MQELDLALVRHVLTKQGVDCSGYSPAFLMRRVRSRTTRLGIETMRRYAGYLRKHLEEVRILLDSLSIGVTSFFRDPCTFEVLRKIVLPALLSAKKEKILRVWDAGCSTGQETYSIAMAVRQALKGEIEKWRISILGTDIDERAIEKARKGEYSAAEVEGVNNSFLEQFFEVSGGKFTIKQAVKKNVSFLRHNLLEEKGFPGTDVIFLRNVLIYLSPDSQLKLARHCWENLAANGYLVLGASELLPAGASTLFRTIDLSCKIYEKVHSKREGGRT